MCLSDKGKGILSETEIADSEVGVTTTLQFLGGLFIPLRQLNNLRKTRIRREIKFIFIFQGPIIITVIVNKKKKSRHNTD